MMDELRWQCWALYERLPCSIRSIATRVYYRPKLGRGVHLYGWSTFSTDVEIGDYTYVKSRGFIGHTKIGKFCCIAEGLSAGLPQHNYTDFSPYDFCGRYSPIRNFELSKRYKNNTGGIVIGNDVWIGQDVVIQDGVTIGDGAVIGTAAVVTKDIPPFAIAVGVPARVIKYRFDEQKIKLMQDIRWWDWEPQKIYENLERLTNFDEGLRRI